MTFLRSLSTSLRRLSERPQGQGQDVERPDLVSHGRIGGNYAAMTKVHSSQGISPLGMGR